MKDQYRTFFARVKALCPNVTAKKNGDIPDSYILKIDHEFSLRLSVSYNEPKVYIEIQHPKSFRILDGGEYAAQSLASVVNALAGVTAAISKVEGKSMSKFNASDQLLTGFNYDELITTVISNHQDRTRENIQLEFDLLLKGKVSEAKIELARNMFRVEEAIADEVSGY